MWILLACHTPDTPASTPPEDFAAPGPFSVGYHLSEVVYPDPAGTGDRSLRLALWYPTTDTSGETPVYDSAFSGIGAHLDAPVADGSFPLLVYSHGHQGFAESSGFLMEHLASHGFVVAAPDHTDDILGDGLRTTEIYYQRPQDISAVLDVLLDDGDFVRGHLKEGPVVALGHSFGGYTVFALAGATYDLATLGPACVAGTGPSEFCSTWSSEAESKFVHGFRDERVSAVVAMAAGDYELFGADGLTTVSVPVMEETATLDDRSVTDGDDYWAALPGAFDRRIQIEGGTQLTFTDYSGTLDATVEGRIDTQEGFDIIDAYSYAWVLRAESADFHDTSDVSEAALLDGESLPYPEVSLMR
jgi:predicted dienelactone hydrolase